MDRLKKTRSSFSIFGYKVVTVTSSIVKIKK